jgi:hypothetical protein
MASYNWGDRRVRERIKGMPEDPRQRNFWELSTGGIIPDETYDYVYRIFSAAVIGEDPKLFGFDFEPPLRKYAHLTAPSLRTEAAYIDAVVPSEINAVRPAAVRHATDFVRCASNLGAVPAAQDAPLWITSRGSGSTSSGFTCVYTAAGVCGAIPRRFGSRDRRRTIGRSARASRISMHLNATRARLAELRRISCS